MQKKSGREKRKPGSNISDEQSPAKRQKNNAKSVTKENEKGKSKMQNLAEGNGAEEPDSTAEKPEHANELQKKDSVPGKSKGYTDECTAFISNINLKASRETLSYFFNQRVRKREYFYLYLCWRS